MTKDGYTQTFKSDDGKVITWDLNGIPWHEAPIPRRCHRHRVQTYGFINWFTLCQRCACGALSINGGAWSGRNNRLESEKPKLKPGDRT